ncbi:hypothetical protein C8Q76DRAFT_486344 [Earliella scabrosa]|nr:hypothetical protein C8Q76DRAFT_486344 [Earliella scabrosa]
MPLPDCRGYVMLLNQHPDRHRKRPRPIGGPHSRDFSTSTYANSSCANMFVAAAATFLTILRTPSLVLALATPPAFIPSASPITDSKGVPTHPIVQSKTNGTQPVAARERPPCRTCSSRPAAPSTVFRR